MDAPWQTDNGPARDPGHAVAERGVPEAAELAEAYREACSPALP